MRVTRVTNVMPRRGATTSCTIRTLGPENELLASIPPVGVVVGAEPAADICLSDPAVSRRHCTIVPRDHGFEVTDLDSRNGTFLEGVAITKAVVPVGAMLRVGNTVFQLLPEEVPVAIEPSNADSFGQLFGSSRAMRHVYAVLERASSSPASILFLGESGTGKELCARAVHDHSKRSSGPFVVFDCGAISETLIESDLFGHKKGAFTGAAADRPGAFARAHKGTLFLDEIGDLPLPLQPKLLRMLEEGVITPLGGHKPERYDVRVVAATHRDLWDEVGRGSFRGDLYYRLAVVEVELPPLRRRSEDIPMLARRFLDDAGIERADTQVIEGPNLDRLVAYHWPGNVRELRNVIQRAAALSAPDTPFSEMPILLRATTTSNIELPAVRADRPFQEAKAEHVMRFERAYLEDLLARAGGNLAEAARRAGVERKYLYRLLDRAKVGRPKR